MKEINSTTDKIKNYIEEYNKLILTEGIFKTDHHIVLHFELGDLDVVYQFSHTYSIWGSDIFNKIDHTSIIFEVVFFRQIISQTVSKFKK
jgi:hypothetical protein